jgi:glutaminyl-peptide cyclotransferase
MMERDLNQHTNTGTKATILKSLLSIATGLGLYSAGLSVAQAAVPTYGFVVKKSYPHDTRAFTEGLFYLDGYLYESTGMKGEGTIRKLDLNSGKVLAGIKVPPQYFGEGITAINGELISLTWQDQLGLTYDLKTFAPKRQFNYPGEGWALTNDGSHIYMSDGTATIRVLDPKTLTEQRRFQVTADGIAVAQLNELEWVDGEIYANIWQTNTIARIDPTSGRIVGWIDLTGIISDKERGADVDNVANGIAWDPMRKRLFVTGKRWPKLYEIKLVKRAVP